MSPTINKTALAKLQKTLPEAKRITQVRLEARHMCAASVMAQLLYIEDFVQSQRIPTEEEEESIILYHITGKELGESDPEWTDPLLVVASEWENLAHPELEVFHEHIWARLRDTLPRAWEQTEAMLKLYPDNEVLIGVQAELKFIDVVLRHKRRPNDEELEFCDVNLARASSKSREPFKSIRKYRDTISAIMMDWKALCYAPDEFHEAAYSRLDLN